MLDKQKELDARVRTVKDKVMVSTMCPQLSGEGKRFQRLQCNHSNSSQSFKQLRSKV